MCKKHILCESSECKDCYEKSFASHEKAQYWSNKNQVTPREVFKKSHKKFYFNCKECKHEIQTDPGSIYRGRWCVYCANKKLCESKDCKSCYEKSFASHEKVKYWSNKNEINPREIIKGTANKYYFNCNECKHTFNIRLECIIRGYWCTYCSSKILCTSKDCINCFNKSFASNEKAKYWSNRNKKTPREVFKNANKKYYFNCNECKHEISKNLNNIISSNSWCCFCSNNKFCNNKKCIICYEKSFANHYRSIYWSDKNKKNPRDYFIGSAKKCFFNCNTCNNVFHMKLNNFVKGHGCNLCKNKTEKIFYKWLKNKEYNFIHQYKKDWCISEHNKKLPFDFCLIDYKLIIEIDGKQHFEQVSNWTCPNETQKRDHFKMKKANENGFSVIRIFQEEIYFNKNEWEKKVLNAIKKYEKPNNIYLSDIYKESGYIDS